MRYFDSPFKKDLKGYENVDKASRMPVFLRSNRKKNLSLLLPLQKMVPGETQTRRYFLLQLLHITLFFPNEVEPTLGCAEHACPLHCPFLADQLCSFMFSYCFVQQLLFSLSSFSIMPGFPGSLPLQAGGSVCGNLCVSLTWKTCCSLWLLSKLFTHTCLPWCAVTAFHLVVQCDCRCCTGIMSMSVSDTD